MVSSPLGHEQHHHLYPGWWGVNCWEPPGTADRQYLRCSCPPLPTKASVNHSAAVFHRGLLIFNGLCCWHQRRQESADMCDNRRFESFLEDKFKEWSMSGGRGDEWNLRSVSRHVRSSHPQLSTLLSLTMVSEFVPKNAQDFVILCVIKKNYR